MYCMLECVNIPRFEFFQVLIIFFPAAPDRYQAFSNNSTTLISHRLAAFTQLYCKFFYLFSIPFFLVVELLITCNSVRIGSLLGFCLNFYQETLYQFVFFTSITTRIKLTIFPVILVDISRQEVLRPVYT
jgi:hypothetical protein